MNNHGNADRFTEYNYSKPEVFNISQMEALPVNVRQLRAATASDPFLSKVYQYTQSVWPCTVPPEFKPFQKEGMS